MIRPTKHGQAQLLGVRTGTTAWGAHSHVVSDPVKHPIVLLYKLITVTVIPKPKFPALQNDRIIQPEPPKDACDGECVRGCAHESEGEREREGDSEGSEGSW